MANETTASTSNDWMQQAKDLLMYNNAEANKTARAVERKTRGVGEVMDQPWQSSTVTNTHNQAGWLKGAILGAALLASGTGGALLIPGLVGPKPVVPQPVQPAQQPAATTQPAPPAPDLNPWDRIQEVQQPDGTFLEKPGSRQPFGKFPKDWIPPGGGLIP